MDKRFQAAPGMTTRDSRGPSIRLGGAALLVCAAGLFAATGHAQTSLPAVQSAGGIEYVTGGFGADGSEAFKQAESSYPLALTFAEEPEGGGSRPYVADVRLVVKDKDGSVVMDVPSVGPFFLARLKPGEYTIEASYKGKVQSEQVSVKEGGTVKKGFAWKS